jgi:hypothetical protein
MQINLKKNRIKRKGTNQIGYNNGVHIKNDIFIKNALVAMLMTKNRMMVRRH